MQQFAVHHGELILHCHIIALIVPQCNMGACLKVKQYFPA